MTDPEPQPLRESRTGDARRRRAVIGLSLVGIAAMGAVTLLQTGAVQHLPDPPVEGFDSDRVNLSETACVMGIPDGSLGLAGFAANVPLAAYGDDARAEKTPWVPLTAAGKAAVEAAVAAWYFYQMPVREKAWCPYCIAGALANWGILALALPEAARAWHELSSPEAGTHALLEPSPPGA